MIWAFVCKSSCGWIPVKNLPYCVQGAFSAKLSHERPDRPDDRLRDRTPTWSPGPGGSIGRSPGPHAHDLAITFGFTVTIALLFACPTGPEGTKREENRPRED